jgi:phage terminase small subunit
VTKKKCRGLGLRGASALNLLDKIGLLCYGKRIIAEAPVAVRPGAFLLARTLTLPRLRRGPLPLPQAGEGLISKGKLMTLATGRQKPRAPNLRQQRFIEEFLRTDNPREAARLAGYAPTTVKQNAANLLRRPSVAAVLRHELDARAERTRIAADRIVLELARVAFSDITRIAEWSEDKGWRLRPPGELSEADSAAIARITRHGGHVYIGLHDKIRALDTLGKYFKLWGKHAAPVGAPVGGGEAATGDYRDEQAFRARAALKARIEAMLAEEAAAAARAEQAVRLREEADWEAGWRAAFG